MIRISNIKISLKKIKDGIPDQNVIIAAIEKEYGFSLKDLNEMTIIKRSLDARKKEDIKYIYTVDIALQNEKKFPLKGNASIAPKDKYQYPVMGTKPMKNRPVVVGMGPAGLFCGLELAKAGYCPLILERGEAVEDRVKSVEAFWHTNDLNTDSNVQFGEGGAGTFSDGKLNTMVKDPFGRHKKVLDTFVSFGAPEEIAYMNKPHIGTDKLREVVRNMRNEIIRLGGQVRFGAKLTNIQSEDGNLTGITINETEHIACDKLVLAIGHSARDTFEMLFGKKMVMEPKAFAIGVRIEHLQKILSFSQYGEAYTKLPPADYKLTHQSKNGRGVYSFCMCPGGFVVNASSEKNRLVINGMSNYNRDETNGNSAIIVSVTPEDFEEPGPLGGVSFQRKWECLAYDIGQGKIPIQRLEDFQKNRVSTGLGEIIPNTKGETTYGNLRECLPAYVTESLLDGIQAFDGKIKGFSNPDAVFSGVETRTSSPVRIIRDDMLESSIKGIYPCGEGAGYAGGITSAAIDGIKVFEQIYQKYRNADRISAIR